MKSLLREDYYTLKNLIPIYMLILAIYGFLFIPTSGVVLYLLVCTTMSSSAMIGRSLSIDEFSRWSKYAMVMPITRKEFVLNKYLILLFSIVIGLILGLIINFIVTLIFGNIEVFNEPLILILSILYPLVCGSVSITLSFAFGSDKVRLIIILVYMLPILILYLFQNLLFDLIISSESLVGLLGILSAIIIIGSILLSFKLFSKKEF